MTTLVDHLEASARAHADRSAVLLDGDRLTYAELEERTARVAGWLRERGIEPGDPVGIMLPNVLAFPVLNLHLGQRLPHLREYRRQQIAGDGCAGRDAHRA